jgi:predicted AlkP superfamily phosphohydrolase/phosphomutase
MNRIVVIALSEASPDLVNTFSKRGRMPHIRSLLTNGLTGCTRYSIPYLLTPQMWATILTGKRPGSHGVFDYWQRRPDGSFYEVRGKDIRGPCIWDEFGKKGVPCGFVNVPMTYPPPQVRGFALSGQDAPGVHRSIAYPRSLYNDVTRQFGRYHHKDIFPGGQDKLNYGRLLPDEVRWQSHLFDWFVRRDDWRFLMLYSSGTAFAQHYFWEDMERGEGIAADVIERTFEASDEMVGRVISALTPNDTVFVISECGAGPIAAGVRLNAWLRQQGFLFYRSEMRSPSLHVRALAKLRSTAQRYLPKSSFYFANLLPAKAWIQGKIAADGIDWSRTVAFHRGKGEGNIYLNVIGRDRYGIVSKYDYERVRNDIIARLSSVVDPRTGERAVAAIHRREELFDGEHVTSAPDLVVEWNGFRYMPAENVSRSDEMFGNRTREYMNWPTSGSHRPEGLLLVNGGRVRPGIVTQPVDLIDLAPTWLAMLKCPLPHVMEGRPVKELML